MTFQTPFPIATPCETFFARPVWSNIHVASSRRKPKMIPKIHKTEPPPILSEYANAAH